MAYGRYRLHGFDYRSNRWYFVTAVTTRRANLFGRMDGVELMPSLLGDVLCEEIELLPQRRPGLEIAISTVLPNHVHLLLGLPATNADPDGKVSLFRAPDGNALGAVVGAWKAGVVRRARREGLWKVGEELWQRRFHDRIIRNGDEWNAIADYILWNSVNWHLDPLSGSREPTDEEVNDWKKRLGM